MQKNQNWEKYKKQLIQLKKELESKISSTPDIIDYGENEDTEADESVNADIQTGIKDHLKARLEDIKSALNKIASDRYGLCEICQKPIEPKVLEIAPESRYCFKHKK